MARQYVSLSMLPMEDIVNYLELIGGFRKKDDIADDTKNVAFIDSNKIAIAALDETGELVIDRNTVENALQLAGKDASEYLTRGDSSTLIADTHKVSTIVSDEISAIRDEIYQMKSELVKSGYLSQNEVYNGFYDAFRNGDIKYNDEEITKIAQPDTQSSITAITVVDASDIMVNEYITIKTKHNSFVARVVDIQGTRVFLDQKITGPLDEFSTVHKTLGIYNNGSFVFGEETDSVVSSHEKTAILKDGKIRKTITELNQDMNGFATTIMIPISMPGVLRKLSVSLAAKGNPGSIKAEIYDVKQIEEEKEFTLLGESNSRLSADATSALRDVEFVFKKDIPVKSGKDYVVLLKTTFSDENNKWFIGGYDEPCLEDVHKDCYNYIGDVFKVANETADMFLSITTNEIIDNHLKLFRQGLYTSNTDIYNNGFTRVRVELKINREGRFKVISNPISLICDTTTSLELKNEDDKSYGAAGIFVPGDDIVIGKEMSKVGETRLNNSVFTLSSPTYCPGNADCYRVGYKVQIIASKKEIKTESPSEPIVTTNKKLIELPLVAVIPGKENGKEDISSDRLIFESEVSTSKGGYTLEDFNNIELQVKWESKGVNEEELQHYTELGGKILDISVSTDRAYNKRKMEEGVE